MGNIRPEAGDKCTGCGQPIPLAEPDLALRKARSPRLRVFHAGCWGAAERTILSEDATLWCLYRRILKRNGVKDAREA